MGAGGVLRDPEYLIFRAFHLVLFSTLFYCPIGSIFHPVPSSSSFHFSPCFIFHHLPFSNRFYFPPCSIFHMFPFCTSLISHPVTHPVTHSLSHLPSPLTLLPPPTLAKPRKNKASRSLLRTEAARDGSSLFISRYHTTFILPPVPQIIIKSC